MACSIILCYCGGNISLSARNSYLFILPDDNRDIFAAALLMSYYNFSSPTFSSIAVTSLYISSNTFSWKHKALSTWRVVTMAKNEYGSLVYILESLLKSSKSVSDEGLIVISWSSCLFLVYLYEYEAVESSEENGYSV